MDRTGTLIDEFLTLSREGREVTDPQPVDLPTINNGCWKTVETDGATLTGTADRSVRADRRRLEQAFENPFRNAVGHGGGDVTVTVGELDDGFHVAGDGPGIPPGERDEAFEAGRSESANGTGFGLSIVKQVVTAHNWRLSVTDGATGVRVLPQLPLALSDESPIVDSEGVAIRTDSIRARTGRPEPRRTDRVRGVRIPCALVF